MDETTITDVRIPFGRMVVIILKWMLASIPAILIMYLIMGLFALAMMAIFGTAIFGLSGMNDKDPGVEKALEMFENGPGGTNQQAEEVPAGNQ